MKEQLTLNKLIAVSGVKGSGKDSVASMLRYCLSVPKIFRQYFFYKHFRKLVKPKYKKLAFADPLKKMLSALLNVPIENFNDRNFKESWLVHVPTLNLNDDLGNKLPDSKFNRLVKSLDPSLAEGYLSIRQLMQYFGTEVMQTHFGRNIWINSTLRHGSKKGTIIADLRFKAEAEAIHELGGVIIYVSRPNYTFGQHASEKEMSELLSNNKYDFIIDNNGTQEDLFNKVKTLCNE